MGSCVAYVDKSASPSIAASDTAKQSVSQAFAAEANVARSLLRSGETCISYVLLRCNIGELPGLADSTT